MKYLGIDYGHKKVGFAESDESGMMAFPMMISDNDKSLLKDTCEIIRALNIQTVVIGQSLDTDGKPNKIATEAKSFGDELTNLMNINVVYEKEWYTTAEARKQPGARDDVDDAAAALILQRYLEKVNPRKFEYSEQEEEEAMGIPMQ